ncbi:MAG: restriction endonuclease [Candidatus Eisenbacteria bacterium]|nr:restriction endonuclease [Candidatus Eisenbacteria bacterium]
MGDDEKLSGRLVIRGDLTGDEPGGYAFGVLKDESAPSELPTIPVVIQALVAPYDKTAEGELVRALSVPWRRIVNALVEQPGLAFEIPPRTWEEIVAAAFDAAGYDQVTLTPRSGDLGRDVIAVRRGVGSIRIIGSVKAYREQHRVRHDDVRALLGVLFADPRATKAILSTTSSFTPGVYTDPLIQRHVPYRLELMDGSSLIKWLREAARDR